MASVNNDSDHPKSTLSSYTWPGIAKVGFVGFVLILCCFMGVAVCILAIVVHQTKFAEQILQMIIGSWFALTPVLGFILKGRAGIRLSIGSCYGLIMPVVSLSATNGGVLLAILLALIMIMGVASLHQPALLQFYRIERPVLSDHLVACVPAILLLVAIVLF